VRDPSPTTPADDESAVSYPGARAPSRSRRVESDGISLSVKEWGDEGAPPVLFAHGGFDFARTLDVFAPLLSDAGWRVVCWDQRGHGDSEHASLYSWNADLRDMLAVLNATSRAPLALIGHSKGGGLGMNLVHAMPERFTRYVNLDGMPSTRPQPDVSEHERIEFAAGGAAAWLDHRRRTATAVRKPGTLDDLARRRGRMNPRLPLAWLRYLASVGARRDADGWRWKLDPIMRFGGFGPWRPGWGIEHLSQVRVPLLGLVCTIEEPMAPFVDPDVLRPHLPPDAELEALEDTGHFIHIERPAQVAERVLAFLS